METFRVGDVEITRVVEWSGPILDAAQMFPDTPAAAWRDLAPQFYEPASGRYRCAIQTWVLRDGTSTVLVDTGVGNGRNRPQVPAFDHLDTPFLERLAEAGVAPQDVDVVVNTHIHYDHVGWNTTDTDGVWAPTFPRARYLVPRADYDYFHPDNADRMRAPVNDDERRRFDGIRYVFADSIEPIEASGQLETWAGSYDLGRHLRLEAAPGHTPGSSVLWLRAGAGAVFVGDLLHAPTQLSCPDDRCAFDLDADQARRSRRQILAEARGSGAWVLPAHFAGHGAATITSVDDGYRIDEWASLPAL